jgi:hypothetical protein
MTKLAFRVASAAFLVLAPVAPAVAQNAGKELALDFRTSTSMEGVAETAVMTGHIVGSGNKVRIDMSTSGGSSPSPLATDGPVSMIVSDSGRTITYLDAKNSEYMSFQPGAMLADAQAMGGVKMVFSDTDAKVESLGAGPKILGHPTARYRVGTRLTMSITGMGQTQTVKIASTTEYHYPTDIRSAMNPFASIAGTDMVGVFGTSNKEFAAKLRAAESKLPKAPPLRTSTTATVTTDGTTRVTRSNTEVTSVQWVNADPKVFEIPAGYTAVKPPTMGGPGSDPR